MAKLASFLRCAIGVQRKFERPEQTIKTKNFRVCVGRTWIILSLAALFACFSIFFFLKIATEVRVLYSSQKILAGQGFRTHFTRGAVL